MGDDSYIYNRVIRGDRIVVDDLYDADYAYTDDPDERYELRKKGLTLGRFDNLNQVNNFLENNETDFFMTGALDEGMDDI